MTGRGVRILQTADNALRVLECLKTSPNPRSLAQVTSELGLAKSVAYSLLFTLKERGFVDQDPNTRHYSLGLHLIALGQAAARRLDLRNIARSYMTELASFTKESVYLMVPGRNMSVLLDRADPQSPIQITMEIGQEGYFHAGSSNKAILAFMADEEIERIIRDVGLPSLRPDTITDPSVLRIQIGKIRESGYVYSAQESFQGIAGLAAPIFDWSGQVVASVGVAGLMQRISPRVDTLAPQVMKTAKCISKELGCVTPENAPQPIAHVDRSLS